MCAQTKCSVWMSLLRRNRRAISSGAVPCSAATLGSGAAEERTHESADELAADSDSDSADGGLGYGLDERVAATAFGGDSGDVVPRFRGYGRSACGWLRTGLSRGCGSAGTGLEHFVSGLAIDDVLVDSGDQGGSDDLLSLLRSDGADLAVGRADEGALDDVGSAFLVEERHEGFADA